MSSRGFDSVGFTERCGGRAKPDTFMMPRDPKDFNVMKWWLNSRDGVDAAVDRDIARSCSNKDGYRSEEEARAHAAMNGMSGVLFTYRCSYCDDWHLTRRRT